MVGLASPGGSYSLAQRIREDVMNQPNKEVTFQSFDWKWAKVPDWAKSTEHIYKTWYLKRYGYETQENLREFLKDKHSILEAGCGLARDSKWFAELNLHARILAVDQSPNAIQVASETLKKFINCTVMRADISDFSCSYNFDFISCDQVLHHTPDPNKTLKHLFGKLNDGGVINFSVCRKKNKYRDLVDDLIMARTPSISREDLWEFARKVTQLGKALYDLGIQNVEFEGRHYESLQRFVHDNVFRCWYNPNIDFELCVSSNYDWFSDNPRFSADEVRNLIMRDVGSYKLLRFYEDDATISISMQKAQPEEETR
jgi:2-polyprenyl-3-methyl-5-hydroxy-6-metoxy-1,4-benzoquinol methylase